MILFLLISLVGMAASPPVYVNTLSAEAIRAMEATASVNPVKLQSEAERTAWARARLAWVSLLRLQGRETDALRVFLGCGAFCGKYGPEKEWMAQKRWGCQKKREADLCLSEKTKAQKPPH